VSTGGISQRQVKGPPRPKFTADFSIDGHSHIESGATAPLPLIWNQTANVRLSRSVLDSVAPLVIRGGKIQRQKTEQIADILASELCSAYKGSKLLEEKPYKDGMAEQQRAEDIFSNKQHIYSPAVIMPMDMDFAHIAGFPPTGSTIYHEASHDKLKMVQVGQGESLEGAVFTDGAYYRPEKAGTVERVVFYDRRNAHDPEDQGDLVDVSEERPNQVWVHQRFRAQMDATLASVRKNPWLLIPMFHYDPRRWCNPSGGEMDDDSWVHGPWDEPFRHIATAKRSGVYIGFKMYPPLGYKPLDPRLPNLEKFYARCEAEGIPVLAHCSPGGMTTHEAKFYHALDRADLTRRPARLVSCTYDSCTPLGYFFDEYVHPKNWRPVLTRFPKLKLCLAHFGGDEMGEIGLASDWVEEITDLCDPRIVRGRNDQGQDVRFENVYTDMSCYDLGESSVRKNVIELLREMQFSRRYRPLQDKVIFGVDWYLSLVTGAPEYREYVESFFDVMSEFDEWQWYRSALVNPATFYGLDKKDLIDKMHKALVGETNAAKEDVKRRLQENYRRIGAVPEQVETIRNELARIRDEASG